MKIENMINKIKILEYIDKTLMLVRKNKAHKFACIAIFQIKISQIVWKNITKIIEIPEKEKIIEKTDFNKNISNKKKNNTLFNLP